MFNITSNQVIKIHKGDKSGKITLFLNQGTKFQPKHYKFYPELSVLQAPEMMVVTIDSDVFYSKTKTDGFFDFEYNYLYDEEGQKIGVIGWYLNGVKINLIDYGITIDSSPSIADHIVIAQFKDHVSEVYFYILDQNADLDEWIVKKTFLSNGEIYTEFADCSQGTLYDKAENVDENNNMVITFASEDTMYLESGEYAYQIRAKLYDIYEDEYTQNTVTKRLPFYVVDGEDSMVW